MVLIVLTSEEKEERAFALGFLIRANAFSIYLPPVPSRFLVRTTTGTSTAKKIELRETPQKFDISGLRSRGL